jgi:predicted transcriptional regulator
VEAMMSRVPHHVTDAELAVLQELWSHGPASMRQLAEALYPGKRASHLATVQKLLERLEERRYVRRDRSADIQIFSAAIDRDELIDRQLRNMAEKFCGGSLTPLFSSLVRAKRLSAQERQTLRALIEELEQKNRTPKARG